MFGKERHQKSASWEPQGGARPKNSLMAKTYRQIGIHKDINKPPPPHPKPINENNQIEKNEKIGKEKSASWEPQEGARPKNALMAKT